MKNSYSITVALAALGAAALAIYLIREGRKHDNMIAQVADEGYETAEDILFSGKINSNKLHYGPVIPK